MTLQDGNRVTLLYFVISSLDILGEMDKVNKKQIIDYVYSLQVLPDKDNPGRPRERTSRHTIQDHLCAFLLSYSNYALIITIYYSQIE